MARITKAELEAKFKVPVYVRWHLIPAHLHTRGWFEMEGVRISRKAQPDALKGGGGFSNHYNFLFDENKYLPVEKLKDIQAKREVQAIQNRPKLKVNYER